jgi:hypothetical protein
LRVYRVDLLDLYRNQLTYRRVCVLIGHLPDDAAVWRVGHPDAGWTRAELLALTIERRVTALWATVASVLGHQLDPAQLAAPITPTTLSAPAPAPTGAGGDQPQLMPLRDIALMMRGA